MSGKSGELEIIEINQHIVSRGSRTGVGSRRNEPSGSRTGVGSSRGRAGRSRTQYRKRRLQSITTLLCLAACCILALPFAGRLKETAQGLAARMGGETSETEAFLNSQNVRDDYPRELLELVEKNEETLDFVQDYSKRGEYQNQPIDLSGEILEGQVPLLMQWDKRWGYDSYGDSIIGLSGCGPTCLTMAYLYFTGDTDMNPRKMSEFAYKNGFCTAAGTSWNLWTEGTAELGLKGETIPLDENRMKQVLDNGGLIVCSMAPGDFTTTGHFILIRGYDGKGFFVNDPNRRSTSAKQWEFQVLQGQIKNLWEINAH